MFLSCLSLSLPCSLKAMKKCPQIRVNNQSCNMAYIVTKKESVVDKRSLKVACVLIRRI